MSPFPDDFVRGVKVGIGSGLAVGAAVDSIIAAGREPDWRLLLQWVIDDARQWERKLDVS
jgi:hypothetical protein